jgi:hypothetical protein
VAAAAAEAAGAQVMPEGTRGTQAWSDRLKDLIPASFKVRYASLQYRWEAEKQKRLTEKNTPSVSHSDSLSQAKTQATALTQTNIPIKPAAGDELTKAALSKLEEKTFANSLIRETYIAQCSSNTNGSPIIVLLTEKGIDPRGQLGKLLTERYDQSLKTHLLELQKEAVAKGYLDLADAQSIGTTRLVESFYSELDGMYAFYSSVVVDEQVRYLNRTEEQNEEPAITRL